MNSNALYGSEDEELNGLNIADRKRMRGGPGLYDIMDTDGCLKPMNKNFIKVSPIEDVFSNKDSASSQTPVFSHNVYLKLEQSRVRTVRILEDLTRSLKPNFLFLSEMLVDSNKVVVLRSKLGFGNYYDVDREGRDGGLAIFWKRNVCISLNEATSNYIDVDFIQNNASVWLMTFFYG